MIIFSPTQSLLGFFLAQILTFCQRQCMLTLVGEIWPDYLTTERCILLLPSLLTEHWVIAYFLDQGSPREEKFSGQIITLQILNKFCFQYADSGTYSYLSHCDTKAGSGRGLHNAGPQPGFVSETFKTYM